MSDTKEIHVRIRGLKNEQYQAIKNLARLKLGTASITRYCKKLLLDQLEPGEKAVIIRRKNNRVELRIDPEVLERLAALASAENMTINGYIAMIIQGYVNHAPVTTTAEVQALYRSNVQLVKIGNNLNQIAKALNLNQQTSLSSVLLNELKGIIDLHTSKVGDILIANIERLK